LTFESSGNPPDAEKAVEVVQNHVNGTRQIERELNLPKPAGNSRWE